MLQGLEGKICHDKNHVKNTYLKAAVLIFECI